jgi:hypothetical protein
MRGKSYFVPLPHFLVREKVEDNARRIYRTLISANMLQQEGHMLCGQPADQDFLTEPGLAS